MTHKLKFLILDKATTELDPVMRDEILDLFLEFTQDEKCSIFFSSHITSNIQKIADYVILIHQGKIIFEEQKDNLVFCLCLICNAFDLGMLGLENSQKSRVYNKLWYT